MRGSRGALSGGLKRFSTFHSWGSKVVFHFPAPQLRPTILGNHSCGLPLEIVQIWCYLSVLLENTDHGFFGP